MLLRIAATAELGTLLVLFSNLATVHSPVVSSAIGPVHGCSYLFVIVLAIREARSAGTRLAALVPGIGGLLVLRRLATERQHGRAS
ncbi:hypothetical protein FHR83_008359 [Actinoplanes campanulatus]|uniref:DUF3817 domain-containing protein n=1 Tax=Actinoplanes campanulatus TaxID=113559 RepID=A0A7W5ARH2_9ACTN|nr:DUF3817 domain-containing protein [Actinoplanes campanulatus]MBB3100634.1 hypothetical protein [Actinoplanes campanulatus]GGN45750.1 hypothetical protein GCM10010109_80280 [Actinoplanes campanulatus]GID41093.1 hypothetical protein Aca09nite_75990 [Actinoplanes campanulatus]